MASPSIWPIRSRVTPCISPMSSSVFGLPSDSLKPHEHPCLPPGEVSKAFSIASPKGKNSISC